MQLSGLFLNAMIHFPKRPRFEVSQAMSPAATCPKNHRVASKLPIRTKYTLPRMECGYNRANEVNRHVAACPTPPDCCAVGPVRSCKEGVDPTEKDVGF